MEDFASSSIQFTRDLITVSAVISQHYSPAGEPLDAEAPFKLQDALEAIGHARDARTIALNLQRTAAAGSPLDNTLVNWWLANLQQDTASGISPILWKLQMGENQSVRPQLIIAAYEEKLQALLLQPTTSYATTRFAFEQLDLEASRTPSLCHALELHAEAIAALTPDAALLLLLLHAHEHELGKLRATTRGELQRVDVHTLTAFDDQLRGHEGCQQARADLAAAHQANLAVIINDDPVAAWEHLQHLAFRWQGGRPAIMPESNPLVGAAFNAYAAHAPEIAAPHAAQRITEVRTTPSRLAALTRLHQQIDPLSPTEQLLFLSHVHRHLLFEPDLAKPSRDRLLILHAAQPAPELKGAFCTLAIGDEVLSHYLSPPEPLPLSAPKIPIMQRILHCITRNIPALKL